MARATGERHGSAKLTVDDVCEIRASTDTIYALAKRFGVSRRQIRRVRSAQHWRVA